MNTNYLYNIEKMKYHKVPNQWYIYKNYQTSMSRRRKDSELSSDRFFDYLTREDVYGYHYKRGQRYSIVIGQEIEMEDELIFKATHFSPYSLKEGLVLLRKMSKSKKHIIVFTVTSDLVEMLQRAGFVSTGLKIKMDFRGEPVEKTVLTQYGNESFVRTLIHKIQEEI